MAKLTDLPAELVHRIIEHFIQYHQWDPHGYQDHGLRHDYNVRMGRIGQKPRPHRENRDSDGISTLVRLRTHHTEETSDDESLHLSWPDGLPSHPLLPLALVSRTFRQCVQETLFKNVALVDKWQAYLFYRSLTRPSPRDGPEPHMLAPNEASDVSQSQERSIKVVPSSGVSPPRLNRLAQYVRSLQFMFRSPHLSGTNGSMALRGSSLVSDILRSCPHLENVAMVCKFLTRCKESILEAFASKQHIREFVIENHTKAPLEFCWLADEVVTRLFSKWDSLETIEFYQLSGRPTEEIERIHRSIPVLNCHLQMIILTKPDLDGREISWLLTSSRESMRTLKILAPSAKLDRPGLYRVLKEHTSPDLESLAIQVEETWHPITADQNVRGSDDPTKTNGLLEIVFRSSSALRKLQHLSVSGPLVDSNCFDLLPQSIIQLSLDWRISGPAFSKALSSWRLIKDDRLPPESCSPPSNFSCCGDQCEPWLANLRCCLVTSDKRWRDEDRKAIIEAMDARGVCYHSSWGDYFSDDDESMSDGESVDDEATELEYEQVGYYRLMGDPDP
ncbi:hypothetical protein PGT21_016562 [Puccinia graminis f. sp. tritici]|uniref:Uncharacterized protein n=2 Tax=Puccinia graminis f. sp. tritici TaxID=56615 RepID=E3KAW0_PUCGT|nr:uncharacterized protein PGTG_06971 [Puccinia graminis f. sp. tritici CRL 75-36-700-3]EFP81350.2 hypothetical protein PGTG_06971 [Puccinia graminis f. sp. tritici CRL 75-36-700-3]KAA1119155.1 hypothetical protein PGT21_016562 [Puccinia graminis f. sp. tritici]